jgi:hypothetical protein
LKKNVDGMKILPPFFIFRIALIAYSSCLSLEKMRAADVERDAERGNKFAIKMIGKDHKRAFKSHRISFKLQVQQ